jgi:hypothetical protein
VACWITAMRQLPLSRLAWLALLRTMELMAPDSYLELKSDASAATAVATSPMAC